MPKKKPNSEKLTNEPATMKMWVDEIRLSVVTTETNERGHPLIIWLHVTHEKAWASRLNYEGETIKTNKMPKELLGFIIDICKMTGWTPAIQMWDREAALKGEDDNVGEDWKMPNRDRLSEALSDLAVPKGQKDC